MADGPPPPAYDDAVQISDQPPPPQQQQPIVYAQPDPTQPYDYVDQQQQPYTQEPIYVQQPPPQQPVVYINGPPPQQQQQQPVVYAQPQPQPPPPQPQPVIYAQPPQPQPQPVVYQEQAQYDTGIDYGDPAIDPNAKMQPVRQESHAVDATADDMGFGESDQYGERLDYTTPVYRDKCWAIAWLIHLFIVIILFFGSFSADSVGSSGSNQGYLIIFVCAVMGVILGYGWVFILRKFAGIIIKFMMWANLIFLIIATVVTFLAGLIFNAIILLIITLFFAFYMWRVWHRIPFAEAMLQIASVIIESYPGIIWTALLMLGIQIFWILIWGATVAILINTGAVGTGYFVYFLLLISLYWNLETFKNISHATTCGVGATWYFSPYPKSPTKASLKRACTTSLGSIALGSLIVAIIQALREMIRQMKQDGRISGLLGCCLDCLLGCIERWVEWFNKYAFAHCAIYGEGFIQSAKQTWALLKSKGIDAWINDDLVGFALVCGALVGGFITAAIAGLMVKFNDEINDDFSTAYAFVGFFVGFYLCWTVLTTVSSCVVAIFVCYAEEPAAMETNRPSEYHKLTAARNDCISPNDYDKQQEQMEQQQQMQQQQQPQYDDQQQQQQYAQQQQYDQQQQPPPQQQQSGNMYGNY